MQIVGEVAPAVRQVAAHHGMRDNGAPLLLRRKRAHQRQAGALLVVSQFTLLADTGKGNRPSFTGAARPELAEPLYEQFCTELRALGVVVATGVFGAKMEIELVNDGPVTIVLEV